MFPKPGHCHNRCTSSRCFLHPLSLFSNQKLSALYESSWMNPLHEYFSADAMPDVSVYRFLISMRDSNGNIERCNKLLISRGWITSPTTIYGTRGKPSLMQRAAMQGYINGNEFTKKAKKILEPHIMVARQGTNAGGQVHKELMKKTIEMIQSMGNYAFVPEERDSFDVGEVETIKDRKSLWDTRKLTVYEIQTDAEPSHIKKCINKAKRYNAKLVIVTNSEKVKESVEIQSGGRAECIVIS
ncbi:MAG: hypothetical protein M1122_00625 [Candidatus Marsarchaeota archaeon]|nr:hypothetical protein [Candidatus Marsarchaeota archaeon]